MESHINHDDSEDLFDEKEDEIDDSAPIEYSLPFVDFG
jgi:hypothetical protein